jgi:hypothetical protein
MHTSVGRELSRGCEVFLYCVQELLPRLLSVKHSGSARDIQTLEQSLRLYAHRQHVICLLGAFEHNFRRADVLPGVPNPARLDPSVGIVSLVPRLLDHVLQLWDRALFRQKHHLDVAVAAEVVTLAPKLVDLGGLVIAQKRYLDSAILLQKAGEDGYDIGGFVLRAFCVDEGGDATGHSLLEGMATELRLLVDVSSGGASKDRHLIYTKTAR